MPRPIAIIAGSAAVLAVLAVTWAVGQTVDEAAGSESWRHGELHARYAQARLKLAETRLEKAEHVNRQIPRQVTDLDLRSLHSQIDLARAELDETRRRPHGYAFAAQRRAAHAAVELAERELAATEAAASDAPNSMAAFDRRLKQEQLAVARLRSEIWDDPAFLASPDEVLQMQIDQLADQLQDLTNEVKNSPAIQRR